MTSKEKEKFRRTKQWKNFRAQVIEEKKHCEFCGSRFRMNLHHKDPDDYTNLISEKFLLLCNPCHKFFELKLSIKNKKNFIEPLKQIIQLFTEKADGF